MFDGGPGVTGWRLPPAGYCVNEITGVRARHARWVRARAWQGVHDGRDRAERVCELGLVYVPVEAPMDGPILQLSGTGSDGIELALCRRTEDRIEADEQSTHPLGIVDMWCPRKSRTDAVIGGCDCLERAEVELGAEQLKHQHEGQWPVAVIIRLP